MSVIGYNYGSVKTPTLNQEFMSFIKSVYSRICIYFFYLFLMHFENCANVSSDVDFYVYSFFAGVQNSRKCPFTTRIL